MSPAIRTKIQGANRYQSKTFCPARSLRQGFSGKNLHPDRDWKTIAFDCNYYDYQHLVHDYRNFTGMKPADFHHLESKAPERIFGLAEHYYETQVV